MKSTEANWPLPHIDLVRCTGCGVCVTLCPTHAVEVRDNLAQIVRAADCSFCDVCETYCPEEAIERPFVVTFAPSG
jgi:Pyruvate/2-oxoacid:ferredoxin oxidoreductase delta subunit